MEIKLPCNHMHASKDEPDDWKCDDCSVRGCCVIVDTHLVLICSVFVRGCAVPARSPPIVLLLDTNSPSGFLIIECDFIYRNRCGRLNIQRLVPPNYLDNYCTDDECDSAQLQKRHREILGCSGYALKKVPADLYYPHHPENDVWATYFLDLGVVYIRSAWNSDSLFASGDFHHVVRVQFSLLRT